MNGIKRRDFVDVGDGVGMGLNGFDLAVLTSQTGLASSFGRGGRDLLRWAVACCSHPWPVVSGY
jgi:hypothetical protein